MSHRHKRYKNPDTFAKQQIRLAATLITETKLSDARKVIENLAQERYRFPALSKILEILWLAEAVSDILSDVLDKEDLSSLDKVGMSKDSLNEFLNFRF